MQLDPSPTMPSDKSLPVAVVEVLLLHNGVAVSRGRTRTVRVAGTPKKPFSSVKLYVMLWFVARLPELATTSVRTTVPEEFSSVTTYS